MKNYFKLHKGFTLAEMMVCLVVASIITTLLIPVVNRLRPNKSRTLFRKAYHMTELIVSELINDYELYSTDDTYEGFDNTYEVSYTNLYVYADDDAETVTYSGDTKFCGLFAYKIDSVEDKNEVCTGSSPSFDDDEPDFHTSDGIAWIMPRDFSDSDAYQKIYIDINGTNAPNCYDDDYTSSDASKVNSASFIQCGKPDRFIIYLKANGKMKVEGTAAKTYIGQINLLDTQQ